MRTNGSLATTAVEKDHYVVGIGASAGGLEPIHEFFDNMPEEGMFTFVVVQHLSPDHKSLMGELLAKHTRMRIIEAEDGMAIRKSCIYLIPSKKVMTLSNGVLKLHDKERSQVPNNAIDVFFESLAQDKKEKAIGVILSGTGTDGTKGIEAIKKNGGLVIVQDPLTADFDGMPSSAIASGFTDLILPPELIPEELVESLKESPYLETLQSFSTDDQTLIDEILGVVKTVTSHNFLDYKKPTITRRLAKSMAENGFSKLKDFQEFLINNEEKVQDLAKEFLINVTRFFRDPEAFEELKTKVIPSIFANKKPNDTIKIWVTACSSGEEAYSVAILFYEYMDSIRNHDYNIKIFATDVDKDVLQIASLGAYPETISKEVNTDRLNRFFVKEGNNYRVTASLRKMVVFAFHDITKDPPFSKLDLITCRNMLIYMNVRLQKHVLKTFLFALNQGACLFLGGSENIGVLKDSMKEISKKWKIYKCIGKSRGVDDTIFMPIQSASIVNNNGNRPKNAVNNLAEIFKDTLMEDHRYAGILIDENMEVRHAIGRFKEFLTFPENSLTFNLLKLVHPDLAIPLGMCIRKAIYEQEKNTIRGIKIREDSIERTVNLVVKPYLQQQDYQQSFIFVVLQEEESERKKTKRKAVPKSDATSQRIEELEKELRETKENLQSLIEELESSNEELLTSNEEMISANEELQSTNEELQSLNEELHTVSAEHQLKIKELIDLNDDLNNYFTSSEIAQILVDKNMIVRKFSPAITKHINLIESDIGRPIMDITNNIQNVDLISDIRKVMLTAESSKREISLADGKTFLMKLNPYIRLDKSIDGVVVNFIDITEMKQLTGIIEGVFNSATSGITVKRPVRNKESEIIDFEYQASNHAAEKIFGMAFGPLSGRWLLRDFSIEKNHFQRYVRVVETGKDDHYEFFNETNSRWYEVVSVKMRDGVVTTFTDITQKKKAADVIAKSFEDLKQTSSKLQETNYRLEQSNMDLLQFASVASHDLKEPLRKIQTFGNILYSKIENKLEPNEKGYLDKIINSSHRMQVLIEDVLTLSKLSNTDLPFEKTDLQDVITHIMEDLEITIRDKGTQVHVASLPVVEAVPGQMHQLFQNLISNALKFNESTIPMIKIQQRNMLDSEAKEYGVDKRDFIGICVEDNGIGFDEKYREKIFGIFQRLHGTSTYQGTGIGLAICKKIVDNHHGFIKAESKLGHGSSFIIFLPAEQTLKIGSNGNGKVHPEKLKTEQSATS